MTPSEILKIQELLKNSNRNNWIVYSVLILVLFLFSFLSQYFITKGQGYATKEDIGKITTTVESIKSSVFINQEVEKLKRELKYNALLKSLKLIDCYFSNYWISDENLVLDKQFSSTEETRECHNQLILTCDNEEVINKFYDVMFYNGQNIGKAMILLSEYRQLVRKELAFGDKNLKLDENKIWFANTNFKSPN